METGPIFAICPVNLKGHRAFSWFQHRPLVHVRNSLIVISSNEQCRTICHVPQEPNQGHATGQLAMPGSSPRGGLGPEARLRSASRPAQCVWPPGADCSQLAPTALDRGGSDTGHRFAHLISADVLVPGFNLRRNPCCRGPLSVGLCCKTQKYRLNKILAKVSSSPVLVRGTPADNLDVGWLSRRPGR